MSPIYAGEVLFQSIIIERFVAMPPRSKVKSPKSSPPPAAFHDFDDGNDDFDDDPRGEFSLQPPFDEHDGVEIVVGSESVMQQTVEQRRRGEPPTVVPTGWLLKRDGLYAGPPIDWRKHPGHVPTFATRAQAENARRMLPQVEELQRGVAGPRVVHVSVHVPRDESVSDPVPSCTIELGADTATTLSAVAAAIGCDLAGAIERLAEWIKVAPLRR